MLDKHHLTAHEEDVMKHEEVSRKKKINRGKLDRENLVLFID